MRAWIEQCLSPTLGSCRRCNRPWVSNAARMRWSPNDGSWKVYRFPRLDTHSVSYQLNRDRFFGLVGVKSHTTPYATGRGCFPLCEQCWAALAPSERLPFYHAMWCEWAIYPGDLVPWGKLEEAVLTEGAERGSW